MILRWSGAGHCLDTSHVIRPDIRDISQQKYQRLSSENNIVTYESALN